MSQKISQGNLFGRIGSGIGQGLAEQIPKEVERGRLASGLQRFEQDSQGLNPIQQLARVSAIPGITPQMIQSFQELAKNQNQGNAYRRSAGGNPAPGQQMEGMSPSASPQGNPSIRDIQFGTSQPQGQQMPQTGSVNNQQATPNINSKENIPQVAPGNALNQQNLTRLPWTPQRRQSSIADYIDQGFLPDQARQLQADDEARDLAEPGANKERLGDIENAKKKVSDALNRHLEKKLQKTGDNLYKDVEGRMQLNAERGMIRDLIQNPKADIDNVANDWSERLYRTAIAKGKLKTLGSTTGIENLFKGDEAYKKLKEYQDIFKKSGNLEEFKNILEAKEFGFSPQAAASVAFPPTPKVNTLIDNFKPSKVFVDTKKVEEARKVALDVAKDLGPDDSILSIARNLSSKDPYFNQQAFFDQFSEDKDQLRLNDRQRLELGEGVRGGLPNWADILYLPLFRR